ncbi:MAG: PAS domain S-box protein, partial [Gammaproteobacteria bacterium]|nr:PAS domain S-box protein [Gammaproteobacteria bacterium]
MSAVPRFRYRLPAILLACSGAFALFDYWSIRSQLERVRLEELSASMQRTAKLIAQTAARGEGDASWWQLLEWVAIEAPHLRYIALTNDRSGIRVAYPQTGTSGSPPSLDPAPPEDWMSGVERADGSAVWREAQRDLLWSAARISADAAADTVPPFALLVADTRVLLAHTAREAQEHALVVFGCALVLMGLLVWGLQRQLSERIGRLVAYARGAVVPDALPLPGGVHDDLAAVGQELVSLRRQLAHGRSEVVHLIDCLPNPVWRTDRAGNCIYVNQAWLDFTGRPREAELGRAWIQDLHPDDVERCLTEIRKASRQRVPFGLEYRMKHRDGSFRWIRDHAEPLHDHQGEFEGYLGACYDIQDILDTTSALAESEARFRGLVEKSSVGVYLFQRRRLAYCNPRMAEMFGRDPETLSRMALRQFIHPDDFRSLWRRFLRLERGAASYGQHEFRVRRGDGGYLWVAVFGSRIVYEGEPGVIGTLIDISERKQAEESIRKSEENLRVTLQSIGDGVIATDDLGRVTLMNAVAEGLTGWFEASARGQALDRVLCLLEPETRVDIRAAQSGAGLPPQAAREALLQSRDGSERPVAFKESPIRLMPDGAVAGGVLVLRDQTEQHQLITALREGERRYRALFEANPHPMWVCDRSTRRFLAVNDAAVSHYGYARDEFLAMTLDDVLASGKPPARLSNLERTTGGIAQHGIQRHQLKDGRIIEVEVVSHTLDFGGRSAELVLANDVTERRVAEAALLASEARFRALFEQAAVGVAQFERSTGCFVQVNRRCCAILGRRQEQIVGAGFETMMHADDVDTYRQHMAELRDEVRAEFSLEQRWCREDGVEVAVYVAVTSMALPGGAASDQCIAVIEDISARKVAERAVRQFQFMVESAIEEIYLARPSGELVYVNAAAARSLGYSVEAMLGLGFTGFDLTYGPDFSSFFAALKAGAGSVVETTH